MPTEAEVESLLVRFTGDMSDYARSLQASLKATQAAVATIEQATARLSKATGKESTEQARRVQAVAQAEARKAQMMMEGKRITQSVESASERYRRESANLNRLLGQGAISQQTFSRAMGRLRNDVRSTSNAFAGLSASVGGFASGILAAVGVAGILGSLTKAVQLSAEFESIAVTFDTIIGDAEKAKLTLAELKAFADWSPFNTQEVMASGKQLLAYGFAAEKLVPTMNMLGDVSGALGLRLGDLAFVYGTLRSQGRAYAVDIRQFAMRGIPIYEALSEVLFGTKNRVEEVKNAISSGSVSFETVEKAFQRMTGAGGMFFDGMQKQSKSLLGLWATMKSEIENVLRGIGDEIVKNLDLKWLTQQVSETAKAFTGWLSTISPQTKRFAMFVAVAIVGLVAIKIAIWAIWVAVAFATGGLSILLVAIIATVAALGAWASQFESLSKAWEYIVKNARAFWHWLKPMLPMIATIAGMMAIMTMPLLALLLPVIAAVALLVEYWDDVKEAVQHFLDELKPIVDYLRDVIPKAAMTARNILLRVWHEIVSAFQTARDKIVAIWDQITGGKSVNWKKMRDGVLNFMLFVEFAFGRMRDIAELAWVGIQYGAVVLMNALLRNVFIAGLVVAFPPILLLFFDNWKEFFTKIRDWMVGWGERLLKFMGKVFSEMVLGAKEVGEKLWDAITNFEKPDIDKIWNEYIKEAMKGARDAIGGVKIDFKGIQIEGLDALQGELHKRWLAESKKMEMSFEEWKKMRLAQMGINPAEAERLANEAKKVGEQIGGGMAKGFEKGAERFDAALVRSVEGLQRLQDYRDRLGEVSFKYQFPVAPMPREVIPKPNAREFGEIFKDPRNLPPALQPRQPEDIQPPKALQQGGGIAQDNDREEIRKLLLRIAVGVEKENQKPGVNLRPANI